MNQLKTICICGGGSQGHISAGVISSKKKYTVNILTRRPTLWSHEFKTIDLTGKEYCGTLDIISDNPAEVIPQSDIVLITVPGFAIKDELYKIKPYLKEYTIIGSVFGGSGFFIACHEVLGTEVKAFALQRVPFTGRPIEYGHSGRLKGYKPYLKVGFMNISTSVQDDLITLLKDWYNTPVYKLSHWLEATLSNSNPLLHPCRMYVMFKDWQPDKIYKRIPYMYNTDWDDESSQCWIDCDNELRQIMAKLPMNIEEVPSILDYYGCSNVQELTHKMQNIEPFKTVQAHMNEVNGGYTLDVTIRYFTEDVPYGLMLIKAFGELTNTPTPNIDKVLYWAQNIMGKEYLLDDKLIGKDVAEGYSPASLSFLKYIQKCK